jgi:transcriptional regulator with XRE-family HTH domain
MELSKAGYSQRKIAAELGLSKTTVNENPEAEQRLTGQSLARISTGWFVFGTVTLASALYSPSSSFA